MPLLISNQAADILFAGDQHGNIRVWDLTANACSCELVPEVGTPVRSLTVAQDASLVIAANNQGTHFHTSAWLSKNACFQCEDQRNISVLQWIVRP